MEQSVGVGEKARTAHSDTERLREEARNTSDVVHNALGIRLERAQRLVDQVDARTRTTKDHVEEINRCVLGSRDATWAFRFPVCGMV